MESLFGAVIVTDLLCVTAFAVLSLVLRVF